MKNGVLGEMVMGNEYVRVYDTIEWLFTHVMAL